MDELGFNKIAGAVLATGLGLMALINAPKVFIKDHYPATPAYSVGEIAQAEAADDKPLPFPQADWVSAMDAAKGAKVFNKCKSCHTVNSGGNNGTGPNLYNLVGNPAGAKAGYSYSGALSGAGINWGFEELDGFLAKPSKYIKGTKMSFIGLKKAEDRAAVIEYLRQSADTPAAQPAAATSEAMAPEMKDGDTAEAVMEAGGEMVEGAADKAEVMVEGAKDKAETMVEGAKDKAETMVDGAKDKADTMIDGAKDKVGDKMNALKDQVKDKVKDPIKDKVDDGH